MNSIPIAVGRSPPTTWSSGWLKSSNDPSFLRPCQIQISTNKNIVEHGLLLVRYRNASPNFFQAGRRAATKSAWFNAEETDSSKYYFFLRPTWQHTHPSSQFLLLMVVMALCHWNPEKKRRQSAANHLPTEIEQLSNLTNLDLPPTDDLLLITCLESLISEQLDG
jgi:hypothetical protein